MKILTLLISMILSLSGIDLKVWGDKAALLDDEEQRVILHKGTELPFVGKYVNTKDSGVYVCKLCANPLYRSESKFESHCGWPSFDDEIKGAIKRVPDADGRRTEIVCAKCGAHLGHVFMGEGYTSKNTRHCVNSISLDFVKVDHASKTGLQKAYFAGGCFWGVEYYLEKLQGVRNVRSGYMGGTLANPTYKDVLGHKTGHLEAVEVSYDLSQISYSSLAKYFFEIHDPTQTDGQGPDIGEQYLSAVFVKNETEKKVIMGLIDTLRQKGYKIATKVLPSKTFYPAEMYHQDYYQKKGTKPYCHGYTKRF